MATQTTDLSNIARQSEKGVPTFERPMGQSLFDTLRDYSGDAVEAAGTIGAIVDAVKGKPAASQPKPPGPAEPGASASKFDWQKYAMIAGGLVAVALLAKFVFKK